MLQQDRRLLYQMFTAFLAQEGAAAVEFDSRDVRNRNVWYLRLDPSDLLRTQFSLDGLMPCVVSTETAFSDSLFSSLERLSRNLGCDHDVGIIVSADPQAALRSRRRGANSLAVLVLTVDDVLTGKTASTGSLRSHLSTVLRTTDHFDQGTPIETEELFFGRADELETVEAALRAGQHCAVFGLRKAGKSSFLNMIQLRLRKAGIPCQRVDLNRYDTQSADQLKVGIIQAVASALRSVSASLPGGLGSLGNRDLPETPRPLEPWQQWLDRLLTYCPQPQGASSNVVLQIDESDRVIETGDSHALNARRERHSLLVELRGYVQERWANDRPGIVLITAGVSRTLIDQPVMWGGDNQLFRLGRGYNLRPLHREEVSNLVRTLGKRSAARFRAHEGIDLLHGQLGGHPLLIRACCSQVLSRRPADAPVPWEVPPSAIEAALARRGATSIHADAASYIESFALHFPVAGDRIRKLVGDPGAAVLDPEPADLGRLYGLLDDDGRLRFRVLSH